MIVIMANALRHNYRAILTYDTVTGEIGKCKFLNENYLFRGDLLATVYTIVIREMDTKKEVVLGISLLNEIYQLSEKKNGYIKEDIYTTQKLNRSKLLYALAQKAKEMGVGVDW